MLPFLWARIPNLHCITKDQGCFFTKTFSLKEKLYHQTFLKRKFNQRTKAVFYQERIVFASEKRGEVCFLFPALIGGEGIWLFQSYLSPGLTLNLISLFPVPWLIFQSYLSPGLKTFSLKEKLYQKNLFLDQTFF